MGAGKSGNMDKNRNVGVNRETREKSRFSRINYSSTMQVRASLCTYINIEYFLSTIVEKPFYVLHIMTNE